MPTRLVTRVAAAAGALAVAATAAVLGASPASAVPGSEIDYNTTGSTTLSNPNSAVTVDFAPTVLRSFVTFNSDQTGTVRAYVPLAPVTESFTSFGRKVSGTVVFTQVGPSLGTLGLQTSHGIPLHVNAQYIVSLRDVTVNGTDANVGDSCQTANPVHIGVNAKPGFNLVTGDLVGTYKLGQFIDCGATQGFINKVLPGTNNKLNLHIELG